METIIRHTLLTLLALAAIAATAAGIYTAATQEIHLAPFFFAAIALIIFKLIKNDTDE